MGVPVKPLSAGLLAAWLRHFAAAVTAAEPLLTDLDRRIGDADHGLNLNRGLAAVAALDPDACASARDYANRAAMALVSGVGGAAGPLYGTFLLRLARALPPDGAITAAEWSAALRAGVAGLVERGRAEPGDKTMLDALVPALDAFDAAPAGTDPFAAAAAAAAAGRDATVDLVARKGRASYLGERSRGIADPGATSAALLVASAAATLS
nr:dihydroxyacetone kinase subunit L [Propionibacterium sp.]